MKRILVLVAFLMLLTSCSGVLAAQKAEATLKPTANNSATGTVTFLQLRDTTQVKVKLTGLTPGKHGFHIHEKGDCSSPDATSAGGHYNPTNKTHGAPTDSIRHVGDLGNLTADANGKAVVTLRDSLLRLTGDNSITNRAVIVHANADDLKSQPAGNAGARVACGVIGATKT